MICIDFITLSAHVVSHRKNKQLGISEPQFNCNCTVERVLGFHFVLYVFSVTLQAQYKRCFCDQNSIP